MKKYDLAVIGGGPAGYHGAAYAARSGMKTVLFEGKVLGGTCLNYGCIPTKTLLNSAKLFYHVKHGEAFGVSCEEAVFEHGIVVKRKQGVVKKLVAGVENTEKFAGVEVFHKYVSFQSRENDGYILTDGEDFWKAEQVIVASGARAVLPSISGMEEARKRGIVVTSTELLDLDRIPEKLVIVGGGVIGLEMACYFAVAGSNVTVVETMPRIGGTIDADLALTVQKELERLGIVFRLNEKVFFIKGNEVSVMDNSGNSSRIEADKILLSVGRRPDLSSLGLEKAGLISGEGQIQIDQNLQMGIPNVYFVGDCNGRSMLAHTAYAEAEYVVDRMLGRRAELNYDWIPSVIYTFPEVASVGIDESEALRRGIKAVSVKIPMTFSGRYMAENENGRGFIKGIADRENGTLLGIHVISDYASEFIAVAGIMIRLGFTVWEAAHMIYPHPANCEMLKTVSEALAERIK